MAVIRGSVAALCIFGLAAFGFDQVIAQPIAESGSLPIRYGLSDNVWHGFPNTYLDTMAFFVVSVTVLFAVSPLKIW